MKTNKENIQIVSGMDAKDYESLAPATGNGRSIATVRIKMRKRDYLHRITSSKKPGR